MPSALAKYLCYDGGITHNRIFRMDPIFEFTVPVFVKGLGGMRGILLKAKEAGVDETALLADRLAPDMFPLSRQVQIACDNAKNGAARLAGVEAPKHEDTEATIDELIACIDKTVAYLATITQESFAGAADRQVTLPYFPGKYLKGFDYAREHALPNFFFHLATAYGLVRKNGVAIGKADYINGLPLQDL